MSRQRALIGLFPKLYIKWYASLYIHLLYDADFDENILNFLRILHKKVRYLEKNAERKKTKMLFLNKRP